jgi:hypothetical protein
MVKRMDELERQLKEDAGLIRADLSPQLQARIRASVESTSPADEVARGALMPPGTNLWWVSSLTGVAAAALIIVLVNWKTATGPVEEQPLPSTPRAVLSIHEGFPLNVETADWAQPLEEELRNLQSDLEKARDNVERDLRISF